MNDEKRQENREVDKRIYRSLLATKRIYISLLATVGIMAVTIYSANGYIFGDTYGFIFYWPIFFLAFVVILLMQARWSFACSALARVHLLIWYACLTTAIFLLLAPISIELVKLVFLSGAAVLIVLSVIWLRNFLRS